MNSEILFPIHYIKHLKYYQLTQSLYLTDFVLFCRDVELGDLVVVGQCRPLSKTVRFNVLKVQKAKSGKKQFSKF